MPANGTRHNLKTAPLHIQTQVLGQRQSKGHSTPNGTAKPENSALDNTALLRDEPSESPRTELLSITSTESTGLGVHRQGNDLLQRLVQANAQQSGQQPSPSSNTPQSPNNPDPNANANPNHRHDKRTSRKHSKEISPQERERTLASVPARELVHMLIEQEHDAKKMRRIIRLAYQNLEVESKRAEDAERANREALEKFRLLNESRLSAQQEVRKTVQELRAYKMKLEAAEQEIGRTQERLKNIAVRKEEAESQATRAKEKMRQLNQMRVLDKAREEGRRDGFMEGLKHGHEDIHGLADYSIPSPDEAIALARSQSDRGPTRIDAHVARGDDESSMSSQSHYPGTFQPQPPQNEDYYGAQEGDGPRSPPRESIPMPEPTFFDEAAHGPLAPPSFPVPRIFSQPELSDPQPDPLLLPAPTDPDLNPNMVPGVNGGVRPPPSPSIESYPIDIPTHDQIERHFSINSQKKPPKLKERIRRISEAARSQHPQQQPPPQVQQQQYYRSQQPSSSSNDHGVGSSSMPMGMLGLTELPPGQDPAAPILMSMGMPMRNSGTIPFLQRQPVPQPQYEGMSEKAKGKQRSEPLWYNYNNSTNANGEPMGVSLRDDGDDRYRDQFEGDDQGFRSIQLEPRPGNEEITEMVRSTPRSGQGIPLTGPPPPGMSTEMEAAEYQFPMQMEQQPFQPQQLLPKRHKSHFRTRSLSLSLHRPFFSSSSNANHANPGSNANPTSNAKPWYQRVLPLSVTKYKRQRHNSIDSADIGVPVAVPIGPGATVKGILVHNDDEEPNEGVILFPHREPHNSGKSASNSQAHQSMLSGRTSDFELISNPRTEAANHVRNSIGRNASTGFWKKVLREKNKDVRLAMITEEMKRQIEESVKVENAASAGGSGSGSGGRGGTLPFSARERAMPAPVNGDSDHAWSQPGPDGGLVHTRSASNLAHTHDEDLSPSWERPIRPPKLIAPENSSQPHSPSVALQTPVAKRASPSSLAVRESPPPAIHVQSPSVSSDHRSWGAKSELPPTPVQAMPTAAPDPPPAVFKPTPPLKPKRRVERRSASATVTTPTSAVDEPSISVTYHAMPFNASDVGEKSHRRSKTATGTSAAVHATTTSGLYHNRTPSSEQPKPSNAIPQTTSPAVKRHHSDKPRSASVTVQPTPESHSHNQSPDKSKHHRSRTVIPEGVGTGLHSVYTPTHITHQQPLSPKSSKHSRSHSYSHPNTHSPTNRFNTYSPSPLNPTTMAQAAKVPSPTSTAHQTNYHTPVSSTSRPIPQPAPAPAHTLKLERAPSASSLRSHGSYEHFDPTTYRDPALFANNEASPDSNDRYNTKNKSSHGHGSNSGHHHQMSSSSTGQYDYIYKPNPAHAGLGHGNGNGSSSSHHGYGHDTNQKANEDEPSTPTMADRLHASRRSKKETYYTSAIYMSDRYPRRH